MTKIINDLGGPAITAIKDHNAANPAAPAITAGHAGAEIAAINILREHGEAGLDMLSPSQRQAVVARMLIPVTGVGEQSAAPLRGRPVINLWSTLLVYAKEAMAGASREQFRVFFLDRKNQLIADEIMGEGTVDHAPVYPREVARRSLELAASAVILAHNHPSGDPTPSAADVQVTRDVANALKAIGIRVHDHIIVGRDGIASLKSLGLF